MRGLNHDHQAGNGYPGCDRPSGYGPGDRSDHDRDRRDDGRPRRNDRGVDDALDDLREEFELLKRDLKWGLVLMVVTVTGVMTVVILLLL